MCWPWTHRYATTALHHVGFWADPARCDAGKPPTRTTTRLLQVCGGCGDARTREIDGTWTVADLRAGSVMDDDDPEVIAPPDPSVMERR